MSQNQYEPEASSSSESTDHLLSVMKVSVEFINKYSWMFDYKVTRILADNVLDSIPKEWRELLSKVSVAEFDNIFLGSSEFCSDILPVSVKDFLKHRNHVLQTSVIKSRELDRSQLSWCQKRGVSPKKEHEIVNLASLVVEQCRAAKVGKVVDIGCGLGYLGEELQRRGLQVDTLSGCVFLRRLKGDLSFPTVELVINEKSKEDLDKVIGPDEKSALVGLHCCGPLTPALLSLFPSLSMAPVFVLVSCCYHRMDPHSAQFPLSQALTSLGHLLPPPSRRPFLLRLGANEGVERWQEQGEAEHSRHMMEVGRRAVLEVVAERRGIKLGRKRAGSTVSERWGVDKVVEAEVEQELRGLGGKLHLLELLTGLQFLMQRVIEELIATDRACYLYECGVPKVNLARIFDGSISPRNIAICASK